MGVLFELAVMTSGSLMFDLNIHLIFMLISTSTTLLSAKTTCHQLSQPDVVDGSAFPTDSKDVLLLPEAMLVRSHYCFHVIQIQSLHIGMPRCI